MGDHRPQSLFLHPERVSPDRVQLTQTAVDELGRDRGRGDASTRGVRSELVHVDPVLSEA
jgi:hypothetical protein